MIDDSRYDCDFSLEEQAEASERHFKYLEEVHGSTNTMINRQEAIEELRNIALYRYAEITGKWDKRATAIDMAIEVLSQPPADQWIPCDPWSMPMEEDYSEGGFLLVQDGGRELHIGYYDEAQGCWVDEIGEPFGDTPVAWRRLPEPYKGVE